VRGPAAAESAAEAQPAAASAAAAAYSHSGGSWGGGGSGCIRAQHPVDDMLQHAGSGSRWTTLKLQLCAEWGLASRGGAVLY
jgi:hypothetical protein